MGKDFSRRAREIDPQKKPARLHLRTWMQGIVDEEALSMPKATDFDRRFDSRRQELSQLYGELYQGNSAALDDFLEMLRRCWRERKRALQDQDRRREADPGWYRRRDMLGMMLYVNAFAGSLGGVEEKLPYLRECGVNYLHLMPLLESPKGRSDGGYAVSDFRTVQPELGTMEDLERLPPGRRAPLPGLRDEPHQRGPPLGPEGPVRRSGVPFPVFLLRQLGHSPGV